MRTMSQDALAILHRFVDRYLDDTEAVLAALADESTPKDARAPLAAVLNYVLDLLDIFPDHYKGLGVVDDAMLLRVGAKLAVDKGATNDKLKALAGEIGDVNTIAGEHAAALDKYVDKLRARTVRGRTVDQILGSKDAFAAFQADISRQVNKGAPEPIPASTNGDWALGELRRMMKHAFKKEGLE